jgi:hypothetical protein
MNRREKTASQAFLFYIFTDLQKQMPKPDFLHLSKTFGCYDYKRRGSGYIVKKTISI